MSQPGLSIFEEFAKVVEKNPTRLAISYQQPKNYTHLTYIEMYYQAIKLGNYFIEKGIKPGDAVAISLPNRPEWPVAFMAIQYAAAIAVPLDSKLSAGDLRKFLEHSQAKILLCPEKNCLNWQLALGAALPGLQVIPADSPEFLSKLGLASRNAVKIEYSPNSPAAIFYTSGTMNKPKGVMLSHRNLLSNLQSIYELGIMTTDDVILALLPLHHTYPFTVTCLLPLIKGAKISYPSNIGSDELLRCMRETGVTVLVGVPQLYSLLTSSIREKLKKISKPALFLLNRLLDGGVLVRKITKLNLNKYLLKNLHRNFGSALRFMVSGGAKLEPKIFSALFRWGFTVIEGYGLTETSPIVALNPPDNFKTGSVGRPIPSVMVKILQPDEKGVGEIAVNGPNLMLGYYKMPQETDLVIDNGWFRTKDLGYIDSENYLFVVGRRDQMIVLSNGKKVDPEEVEAHYSVSHFIKEICVFAAGSKGFAEGANQLMAVVVPNQEHFAAHGLSNQIQEKIKSELDSLSSGLHAHKRVKGFVLANEPLPRTALGKLMRHAIGEKYSQVSVVPQHEEELITEEEASLMSNLAYSKLLNYLSQRLQREVKLSDHLELDLGLDSLGRMELLLEMQHFLKIEIPDDKIMELFYCTTIEELLLKAQPYL